MISQRVNQVLTNLIKFFERIFLLDDQGDSQAIIYLYFSKAFDKVRHNRLIKKLEGYDIQGNVLRWITEWLGDRTQRVHLNGYRLGGWRLEVESTRICSGYTSFYYFH